MVFALLNPLVLDSIGPSVVTPLVVSAFLIFKV